MESANVTVMRPRLPAVAMPALCPRLGLCGNPAVAFALDLQRDVDELVFLAANQLALTGPVQQLVRRDAVPLALPDGVLEEAGVDAGIPHDQRVAVQHAFGRHGRAHNVFGGVGDVEEVDAGLDADLVEHANRALDRSVARARTEAPHTAVDLLGARAYCLHGVCYSQPEVLVAVEADLCVLAEFSNQGRHPVG